MDVFFVAAGSVVRCGLFYLRRGGQLFVGAGPTYVSFWMPAGLSIAVFLLNKTRDWPWFLVALFLANYLFDHFHGTRPAMAFLLLFRECR